MRQWSERGLPSVSILIFSHFVQTVLTSRLLPRTQTRGWTEPLKMRQGDLTQNARLIRPALIYSTYLPMDARNASGEAPERPEEEKKTPN